MKKAKLAGLAALVLMALPLAAHHGTATSFDSKKVVKIAGLVKEFRWRNPHSELAIDGKDDAGNAITYSVELGAPAQLAMEGLTRHTFNPGDQVSFEIHPSFVNPAYGTSAGKFWLNGKEVQLGTKEK